MTMKKMRAARANGTALGNCKATTASVPEYSGVLPQFQADFIASRFGLSPAVAATVARLAFGEMRA